MKITLIIMIKKSTRTNNPQRQGEKKDGPILKDVKKLHTNQPS